MSSVGEHTEKNTVCQFGKWDDNLFKSSMYMYHLTSWTYPGLLQKAIEKSLNVRLYTSVQGFIYSSPKLQTTKMSFIRQMAGSLMECSYGSFL